MAAVQALSASTNTAAGRQTANARDLKAMQDIKAAQEAARKAALEKDEQEKQAQMASKNTAAAAAVPPVPPAGNAKIKEFWLPLFRELAQELNSLENWLNNKSALEIQNFIEGDQSIIKSQERFHNKLTSIEETLPQEVKNLKEKIGLQSLIDTLKKSCIAGERSGRPSFYVQDFATSHKPTIISQTRLVQQRLRHLMDYLNK